MAVIEFKGYKVVKYKYERNEGFIRNPEEKISVESDLNAETKISKNEAFISMAVVVGSLEDTSSPFRVETLIKGYFEYNFEEDEGQIGFKNFLEVNGVAILYPYLRSLISNITNMSNEFPGYNMPTINVHEVLKESKEKNDSQDI